VTSQVPGIRNRLNSAKNTHYRSQSATDTEHFSHILVSHFGSNRIEKAVAGVVSRDFGVPGTVRQLEGEVDETFRIDTAGGTRFLIKVAQAGESEAAVSFQTGLLRHLQLAEPDLPVPRLRPTADGADYLIPQAGPLEGRIIRVISFLPGDPLRVVRSTRPLREQIGRNLAILGRALRDYDHPAAHRHVVWTSSM
jgi:hydroxylysine kinase